MGPVRWGSLLRLLILTLLVAEVGARVGVYLWAGKPFRSLDPYVFMQDGGYWNNPDYTHPYFVHNSAGFRNTEEFAVQKPERTLRILAIGGSTLYSGVSVTPFGWPTKPGTDKVLTAFLRRRIEEDAAFTGWKVEVMNAGLNLSGLRENAVNFLANLSQYGPDVLLVFGSSNHFLHSSAVELAKPFGSKPSRPFGERFELAANDRTLQGLAERAVRTATYYSAFWGASYRLLDRTFEAANARVQAATAPRPPGASVADVDLPLERLGYVVENLDVAYTEYAGFLEAIFAFCRVHGIRPALFWEYYLVNLHGVKPYSGYETALSEYYLARDSRGGWANTPLYFHMRDRIAERARKSDVPMVDLIEDFRDYSGTVFNDYLHYSEDGNRWVAERIFARLRPLFLSVTTGAGGPGAAAPPR